ncbi:MAG: SAM-dependent chlorinase/fluorinase [bacterium]|nr:SAM-dependent chlorinase/fluorinase [bacterium]
MTHDCEWRPNGLVTWTTDFGLQNAFVGTMRGVFHSQFPEGRWVDLTHGIPAQDKVAGAFELRHAHGYFPSGTLHVAIVDPGVGTDRRILVAEQDGHLFLLPDNGLLGGVLDGEIRVWAPESAPWELPNRGFTFHGRDVFAPMAAALAGGRLIPGVEDRFPHWDRGQVLRPILQPEGHFELTILMVDRFGNAVTNWDVSHSGPLPGGAEVRIGSHAVPIVNTYAEVPCTGVLALIDSHGHLEIAQRNGSAAEYFALGVGDVLQLRIKP